MRSGVDGTPWSPGLQPATRQRGLSQDIRSPGNACCVECSACSAIGGTRDRHMLVYTRGQAVRNDLARAGNGIPGDIEKNVIVQILHVGQRRGMIVTDVHEAVLTKSVIEYVLASYQCVGSVRQRHVSTATRRCAVPKLGAGGTKIDRRPLVPQFGRRDGGGVRTAVNKTRCASICSRNDSGTSSHTNRSTRNGRLLSSNASRKSPTCRRCSSVAKTTRSRSDCGREVHFTRDPYTQAVVPPGAAEATPGPSCGPRS